MRHEELPLRSKQELALASQPFFPLSPEGDSPQKGIFVVCTVAEPLAQCHHAPAFPLTTPVEEGVKLGAQALAPRS